MAAIPDITLEQKFEAICICHNAAVCMNIMIFFAIYFTNVFASQLFFHANFLLRELNSIRNNFK